MKKIKLLSLVFLMIGEICFAQTVANQNVLKALIIFEFEYPEYVGKVYLTGGNGNRSWQRQMEFILERPTQYPNISRRFTKIFGIQLPASVSAMTPEMLNWWEKEIMAQAGRPDGFAHVGGKAQDISVRNLDVKGKLLLEQYIKCLGMGIIYEQPPRYYVSIEEATVFHCYIN